MGFIKKHTHTKTSNQNKTINLSVGAIVLPTFLFQQRTIWVFI